MVTFQDQIDDLMKKLKERCPICDTEAIKVDMIMSSYWQCPNCKEDIEFLKKKKLELEKNQESSTRDIPYEYIKAVPLDDDYTIGAYVYTNNNVKNLWKKDEKLTIVNYEKNSKMIELVTDNNLRLKGQIDYNYILVDDGSTYLLNSLLGKEIRKNKT